MRYNVGDLITIESGNDLISLRKIIALDFNMKKVKLQTLALTDSLEALSSNGYDERGDWDFDDLEVGSGMIVDYAFGSNTLTPGLFGLNAWLPSSYKPVPIIIGRRDAPAAKAVNACTCSMRDLMMRGCRGECEK